MAGRMSRSHGSVQVTFTMPRAMGPVDRQQQLRHFRRRAGMGPGIFFNFISHGSAALNAPAVTAIGWRCHMYGTGLGL